MKIDIIGAGIGGCVAAMQISKIKNTEVNLYEKKSEILNSGMPWCHLHISGGLYPDISIKDCIKLFNVSLLFIEMFPNCMLNRPTIIGYNKKSKYNPRDLITRCEIIENIYKKTKSNLLGSSDTFYAIYTKQDVINYKKTGEFTRSFSNRRNYHDKFFGIFCDILNESSINSIKYPICSIREPGIDMEIVKNKIKYELKKNNVNIIVVNNNYKNNDSDFVINAMGYENRRKSFLELKSSWTFKMDKSHNLDFPEIAIIGERGTKDGLLQISPRDEYTFQIHYMNINSTIFECVKSFSDFSDENQNIIKNNEIGVSMINRSNEALKQTNNFFNYFNSAKFEYAEWGIQRIPMTNDETNRVATINVDIKNKTADIDIVKGISSVYAANQLVYIIENLSKY